MGGEGLFAWRHNFDRIAVAPQQELGFTLTFKIIHSGHFTMASASSNLNSNHATSSTVDPGSLKLASQRLAADPRIEQAKRLILAALEEHQHGINQVRSADPALVGAYQEQLDRFAKLRGGALYYPYISSGLGNGPFVELQDGSVKLDMITGIGVHGFGHSHPTLVAAGIDAALSDTVMQGNLQQNGPSVELCELLVNTAQESGSQIQHCILSTSGAMANENSLKMAFQKNAPADRIFAFDNCFCGRTIALSNITDRPAYRAGLPVTTTVDYLPFYDYQNPGESLQRTMQVFEQQVARYPGKHAILWMELIAGEGGYYPGSEEFFQTLCKRSRELNIAVICDEVQTFARTSRPFAFQHFKLDPWVDLVTIGKITQVCATLFTDAYKPKPGLVSQTFTGSSWAILSGLAIVKGLIAGGHFNTHLPDSKNMQLHELFVAGIKQVGKKFPGSISGPHGLGGMVAITPFDGSADVAKDLAMRLYHAGLMSFIAGGSPYRVRFLMPLGATEPKHIEQACEILERVIEEMVS